MRENPTFESYQFRGALIRKTPKWYTSGSYPPDDAPCSALRAISPKGKGETGCDFFQLRASHSAGKKSQLKLSALRFASNYSLREKEMGIGVLEWRNAANG